MSDSSQTLTREQGEEVERLERLIDEALDREVSTGGVIRVKLEGHILLPERNVMDELTKIFQKKGWEQLRFKSSHVYGALVELS